MRCPRCRREVPEKTAFCTGCGAPLRLAEEPPPIPVDASISIDRRAGAEPTVADVIPGTPAPPPRGELADVERSFWEMGRRVPPARARPAERPELGPTTEIKLDDEERQLEQEEERYLQPDHDLPTIARREVHVVRPATWRRAAAWAVDGIPFLAGALALARTFLREATLARPVVGVDGVLDLLARERVIVLSVAAAATLALAVYATLSHALAGATLGKRIFHLRIVGPDGRRPTLARSATRSALAFASAGLLGLGFLLALFTRSGRALHDLVSRTWVVVAP